MPYYKCKCGSKYVGWGCSGFCQKCGDKMKKISREEFYGDEERGLEYSEEGGQEEEKEDTKIEEERWRKAILKAKRFVETFILNGRR